mmetsp:Transcript_104703/g.208026  ORF Transcript_104703/g.208026 Transcript_104703/m.208026 type:complete len:194 (-) Transcript_104703:67-648(-)
MEGSKTKLVRARGGSNMLGALLLFALVGITTASGNYCLKIYTKVNGQSPAGYMKVVVHLQGGAEHPIDAGKDLLYTGIVVDQCWDNPVENVKVTGPNTDGWIGTVKYSSPEDSGTLKKNMKCEDCTGSKKTVDTELLVEKEADNDDDGTKAMCQNGKTCTLTPPKQNKAVLSSAISPHGLVALFSVWVASIVS